MRSPRARALCAGRFSAVLRLTAVLAFAVAAVATSLPVAAAPAAIGAPWCNASGPLRAQSLPPVAMPAQCALDGRVIEDHGVTVRVPDRGHRVGAETMLTDGSTQLLEVTRRLDGAIVLGDVGDDRVEGADAGGSGSIGRSACEDDAFDLSDYRDTNTRVWHYRASTTPPGLSIGAVAQEFVNAFNAITASSNDCGLADEVEATQRYGGGTDVGSGIDHTGACPAKGDGNYVVDFGNLPETTLARSCWRGLRTAQGWYEITEADVKIRKGAPLFTGAVPAGCGGPRYSIEAIMTHEAGHTFGLRHVTEADHPELTMSERTPACSRAPAKLGLGDVKALRAAY